MLNATHGSANAVAAQTRTSPTLEIAALLEQGLNCLQLQDFGGADAALSQVLECEPEHQQALVGRAEARYGMGYFDKAEGDFTQSLRSQGPSALQARAHTGLAHVLSRSVAPGALDAANGHLTAAQQVYQGGPTPVWHKLAQARVAFETGDVVAAQQSATSLLQQHRHDPRAWLVMAEMCEARGQYAEAAEAAQRACNNGLDDTSSVMADTLRHLHDDRAESDSSLLGCLRHLHARLGSSGFELALQQLAQPDLDDTAKQKLYASANQLRVSPVVWLEKATTGGMAVQGTAASLRSNTETPLCPATVPAALAACAVAALRLRGPRWQQTFDASYELLMQRSGPRGFWTLITKAEQAIDTPRRVAQLLDAAAAINPNDRMTKALLLRVQSRMGELDVNLLSDVVHSRPEGSQVSRILSLQLEVENAKMHGQYDQAIEALDVLCSITQDPRDYALRASLKLACNHDPAQVRHDCAMALSFDGLNFTALYTRAQQDARCREFSAAEKNLQLCRAKHPDQPDPQYWLGEIAMEQGFSDVAIEHFGTYLDSSFPIGRQFEGEARLALAEALLAKRDYAGATRRLVQIDQSHPLQEKARKLRNLVDERKILEQCGELWWADLKDIHDLIVAKKYLSALATLHHHGAKNACNAYAIALRAWTHLEMGNFAQAEADAQIAQDIAWHTSLNEPLSARVLREAQAQNTSIIHSLSRSLMGAVRYFQA